MHDTLPWQDALMRLHLRGWDTDEIDAACEALIEACEEGGESADQVTDLSAAEIEEILELEIPDDEIPALVTIAELRARQDDEAEELNEALYDLDAFAYAYSEEEE